MDWPLADLERILAQTQADMIAAAGTFELNPDFQRGHVWTPSQQVSFVESFIRGMTAGRVLFNCPGWVNSARVDGDIQANRFQCIDGLQRLTALRKFMSDEILVFSGFRASDLRGSPFDPWRLGYRLQVGIYEFQSRADLLRFYLDRCRRHTSFGDRNCTGHAVV